MFDMNYVILESEGEVLHAIAECYIKETIINSIIMEETKPSTSRWDRIRGWLAKVGQWFRNAISWILNKLGSLFKKQNQINTVIQQTEASNTSMPKIDPQKYPHIALADDYQIQGVKVPKSFNECFEYIMGYNNEGIWVQLDDMFDDIKESFVNGQPPHISDNKLSKFYQSIDKCNELLSSVKSDDITDLKLVGYLKINGKAILSDLSDINNDFRIINDKFSKLSPEDKQKYDNVINTITEAYQKETTVLKSLLRIYNEIYSVIDSEMDQLSTELQRNNGDENQTTQTNQNDQRTPERKLWDEFKGMHPAQDGETPDQYKQRVSKMWEKYKNNPENQNRFNQGNGMLDKFKK